MQRASGRSDYVVGDRTWFTGYDTGTGPMFIVW